MCVSAGHDQTKERRFQIRMFNIVGRNMSFYMMHSNKRKLFRICNGLRLSYAHKKSTYQARTVSNANCIQIIQGHICLGKCLFDHLIDFLNMFT